jgi:hypothetical protein
MPLIALAMPKVSLGRAGIEIGKQGKQLIVDAGNYLRTKQSWVQVLPGGPVHHTVRCEGV